MARTPLRRLFPEHVLHIAFAPHDRHGSPDELFTDPDRGHWFGVADAGRAEALLRAHRVEMAGAVHRGTPIVVALQCHADALQIEEWLTSLRPDWTMRYSLELLDEFEERGMIGALAELAEPA